MDYITYVSFVMISALTPGQGILLTVINSINFGFKKNLYTILGIVSALATLSMITMFALKAILEVVPNLYTYLQLIGGAYLTYLGYKMFASHSHIDLHKTKDILKTNFSMYKEAYLISVLNPKQIFFLSSVLPLFLKDTQNYYLDIAILLVIFVTITISKHFLYSFFAVKITSKIKNPDIFINRVNKVSGTIFILIGITLLVKLFL